MIEDIVVEPMTEEFILWRCLHGGPLSCKTIDLWLESMLTLHNHPCLVSTSQEDIKNRIRYLHCYVLLKRTFFSTQTMRKMLLPFYTVLRFKYRDRMRTLAKIQKLAKILKTIDFLALILCCLCNSKDICSC
jgi:hypothetical protein